MVSAGDALPKAIETEARECEHHGEFQAKRYNFAGSGEWWSECPACAEERVKAEKRAEEDRRRDAKLTRMIHETGIETRYLESTLDAMRIGCEKEGRAVATLKDYLAKFDEYAREGRSLVLCGTTGTGKTHGACAIALELTRRGKLARYTTVARAIRAVRATWGEEKRDEAGRTELDVFRMFRDLDLLVLDEVGVQLGTDSERQIMTEILDGRYMAEKPTIVISNLDAKGIREFLGDRVIDRLREGGGTMLVFDWPSFRRRGA